MSAAGERCLSDKFVFCSQHEGWRHPRSVGDVIGSVADQVDVRDTDGDLVLDAHLGPRFTDYKDESWPMQREHAKNRQDNLVEVSIEDGVRVVRERIAYRYCRSHMEDAFRKGEVTIWWEVDLHGYLEQGGDSGEIVSYEWPYWLISTQGPRVDSHLSPQEMAEVRKSLGLEK